MSVLDFDCTPKTNCELWPITAIFETPPSEKKKGSNPLNQKSKD
ncbi:hypothetical protein RM549_13365 [Salegentibacter sp. F188]|uniref:Uncharacterized protein n=1 Tax=Autumnicola patrickiae TaxID=3075591 RepID=A0ABU3E464_9FLAO|nr:hypothetical protein [Salegentibacter sp. F188]MDT0690783.1 hypothetical protein [Salegentibacter sp. F188]